METKCNSCEKSTACAIRDKVDAMEDSFCGRTEGVIIGIIECPYHKEEGGDRWHTQTRYPD